MMIPVGCMGTWIHVVHSPLGYSHKGESPVNEEPRHFLKQVIGIKVLVILIDFVSMFCREGRERDKWRNCMERGMIMGKTDCMGKGERKPGCAAALKMSCGMHANKT